jgi:hypothetical protein
MAQGNNNGRNVRYLKRRRFEASETGVRITNEAYKNQQSDYSRLDQPRGLVVRTSHY